MSRISIGGIRYKVVEKLGFQPKHNLYAAAVSLDGTRRDVRIAVKRAGGQWRFLTAGDGAAPKQKRVRVYPNPPPVLGQRNVNTKKEARDA